ncbi:class I SAM-dependent methyltransferase [Stackebrandtia nassauensis]|uniref:Methyltransferase type 11 n=1 Tax=Stackebrandtia nassauensis (strain DSM 44728 / CIP 108903 / NRRL B-16338 / NBRC 102104 / LLR-40K-21) TaxID=446470 RepID=D3Q6L5_STANL|nr:class I SAM-dependent methyltransferase [Stackebrandtia nassauensis]ADD44258.1 Methyltransferase type 11 [Stackebrandtia nassauensis DSM 44728]
MNALTPDFARSWLARWDRQQEGYLPEREERFTAIIDAVEAGVDRPDPVIIDLGCGPGSLSVRLLDRLPKATVVAVDADPVLLALGEAAYGDRAGLRFVKADLVELGWTTALGLERPADAAVSTTALHWLDPTDLRRMYANLATVLAPGALFLNGDHLYVDKETRLAKLENALVDTLKDRVFGDNPPESWALWWDAVAADPVLAPLFAKREIAAHYGSPAGQLATHVEALDAAGFSEVGTIWQVGNDRVLCGVR